MRQYNCFSITGKDLEYCNLSEKYTANHEWKCCHHIARNDCDDKINNLKNSTERGEKVRTTVRRQHLVTSNIP